MSKIFTLKHLHIKFDLRVIRNLNEALVNKRVLQIFHHTRANIITRKNSFCKTSFQVGMDMKKVQKQGREMKECKKTALNWQKNTADAG